MRDKWGTTRGVGCADGTRKQLAGAPHVAPHYWLTVAKFASYEMPRAIHLEAVPWTAAAGLLTASLKLQRRGVLAKYADVVTAMYRCDSMWTTEFH